MSSTSLKQKSKEVDFEKEYVKLNKKATEFTKYQYPSLPFNNTVQETFKKFSLYKDFPNSITSFNTDAVL